METVMENNELERPGGDKMVSAGILADRLRPLVLAGESACLNGTPMIPFHRGTVTAIYMHLERLAGLDGEKTIGALEWDLAATDARKDPS
jgi:hypothetical protein